MNIEELQSLRADLAAIIVKVEKSNWEYEFLGDAIAVLDEMLKEQSQNVLMLEKSYNIM